MKKLHDKPKVFDTNGLRLSTWILILEPGYWADSFLWSMSLLNFDSLVYNFEMEGYLMKMFGLRFLSDKFEPYNAK